MTKHDKPIAEITPVREKRVPVLGAFADQLSSIPAEAFAWTDDELYELWGEEYGVEKPAK